MIVQIFGAVDLAAALLMYLGKFPVPDSIVAACIIGLLIKGIISFYPLPIYMPGIMMNVLDILSAALLYLGNTPLSGMKAVVIAVLVVKSFPSIITSIFFIAAGLFGRKS